MAAEMNDRRGVMVIGDAVVALQGDQCVANSRQFTRYIMGECLIAAVTMSRMGLPTSFVTRLGEDPLTDWLLSVWDDEALHLDYVKTVPGRNGYMLSGATSRERVVLREGSAAAGLTSSDLEHFPYELAQFVYSSGSTQMLSDSTRTMVRDAFVEAKQKGTQTIYNASFDPQDGTDARHTIQAFDELIGLTDILLIRSPLATGQLLMQAQAEDAAKAALKRGPSTVVIRDGSRGHVLATHDRFLIIDRPVPNVAQGMETAFDGAFIAALSRGRDVREAIELGYQALSCVAEGGMGLAALPLAGQL
jgi:2-dehydro-3-deoxygluconokinase